MKHSYKKTKLLLSVSTLALILGGLSTPARADCTSPASPEGGFAYFTVDDTYRLCDGADNWVTLLSSGTLVTEINDLSDALADYATDHNLIMGRASAAALTSGAAGNVFIGENAGATTANSTAATDYNTALGYGALFSLTSGESNVAIGNSSMYDNTTGGYNTALGRSSLGNNTIGGYNIAMGYMALGNNIDGSNNVALGINALYSNVDGQGNTATGNNALYSNTSGRYNVATGHNALNSNTVAYNNTAIGYQALQSNVAKSRNTAIGYEAMRYADDTASTSNSNNTALGYQALQGSTTAANNTGVENTAIGVSTLLNNTSGEHNVVLGFQTGDLNTTGSDNILIGYDVDAPLATTSDHLNIGNLITGDIANNNVTIDAEANAAGGLILTTDQGGLVGDLLTLANTNGGGNAVGVQFNVTSTQQANIYSWDSGLYLSTPSGTSNQIAFLTNDTYRMHITSTGEIGIGDFNADTVDSALHLASGEIRLDGGAANEAGCIRFDDTSDQLEYSDDCSTFTSFASLGGSIAINDLTDAYTDYATDHNMFFGNTAGAAILAGGTDNIFIGETAGASTTTGDSNIFIGRTAGTNNTTGQWNTFVGDDSGQSNIGGSYNTGFGGYSLRANTSGTENTAIGDGTLEVNTTGNYNTALGRQALFASITGNSNVAIGRNSLHASNGVSGNTAVGTNSLSISTTGANNTVLGYQAGDIITTGSDNILIGYDVDTPLATTSDHLNIGDTIYGDLANNYVGIGTTTPLEELHVRKNDAGNPPIIQIQNDAAFGPAGIRLMRNTTKDGTAFVGFGNGNTTNEWSIGIRDTDLDFAIWDSDTGDVNRFEIDATTGNTGIGDFSSDTIDSTLHLASGDIRLDGGAANEAGCIRFDDTTDALQYSHDCATFTDLGSSAPAGNDREVQFNDGGTALGASTALSLSTNNRLLVKHNAEIATPSSNISFQIATASSADGDMLMHVSNNASGTAADIVFQRSSGDLTTPTTVEDGDKIGSLRFVGYDGTSYLRTAQIMAEVDGSVSTTNVPTSLVFKTTDSGGGDGIESMRITPNNRVLIGNGGTADGTLTLYRSGFPDFQMESGAVTLPDFSGSSSLDMVDNTNSFGWFGHDLGGGGGDTDGGLVVLGLTDSGASGIQPLTLVGMHSSNTPTVAAVTISGQKWDGTNNRSVLSASEIIFDVEGRYDEGITALRVMGDGKIGMGDFSSDTIESTLHLASGEIRLDGGAANEAGCIRFDDTSDQLEFSHDCATYTEFGAVAAAGSDREIQYNDGGTALGASSNFVYSTEGNLELVGTWTGTPAGPAQADNTSPRMFFLPGNSAFRAGSPFGDQMTDAKIGDYSAAFGYDTEASGDGSFAAGGSNDATGDYSVAMGQVSNATGNYSFSMGFNTVASGNYSTATGNASIASGNESTALGAGGEASGAGSLSVGNNEASGIFAIALGDEVVAGSGTAADGAGDYAFAIGLQSANQGTDPTITGDRSMVLFMDGNVANANSTYDFTEDDKFAVIGGEFQIDDVSASANKGCIRYNSASTKIEFSHDCSTYTEFGAIASGTLDIDDLGDAVTDYATDHNMFLGDSSGAAIASGGQYNTALGESAGAAVSTGDQNTIYGYNAGLTLDTGSWNTIIGTNAGSTLTSTNATVMIGSSAGSASTGGESVIIGASAGQLATGSRNIFMGWHAGQGNTSGYDNIFIGHNVGDVNGSGYSNVMLGSGSGATSTGIQNVFLGAGTAGTLTSGSDNILIGYNADVPAAATSDHLNIGNTIYGDISSGYVGIGTNAPNSDLEIYNNTASPEIRINAGNGSSGYDPTLILGIADSDTSTIRYDQSDANIYIQNTYNNTLTEGGVRFITGAYTTGEPILSIEAKTNAGLGIWEVSPDAYLEIAPDPTTGTADYLMLSSAAANDGDIFIVNSSGDVGIGTASPNTDLEVFTANNATDTILRVTSGVDSGSTARSEIQLIEGNSGGYNRGINMYYDGAAGDHFGIEVINSGGPTEALRIERSSGDLGLGDFSSDSIESTLHIASGDIRIDGGAGNAAGCLRYNDTADEMEYSDDCSTFTSLASLAGGLWTDNTTHITRENFHILDNTQTVDTAGLNAGATDISFIWDGTKGALRAGEDDYGAWNDANIGLGSIALGYNTIASGQTSVAMGSGSQATQNFAIAMGTATEATGFGSIALGAEVDVTGNYSMGFGLGGQGITTDPIVSGNGSFGVFLGDNSGANLTTDNVMAIMGGDVGIGTTSPGLYGAADLSLTVSTTTADTGANIEIQGNKTGSNANYASLLMYNGSSNGAGIIGRREGNDTSAAMLFSTSDTGTFSEKARFSPEGYFGIANSSPDVELDVTGDIEYSGTITDVSDMRLKENIIPLIKTGSLLNRLDQIDTYSFTMKDDKKGHTEFGVMAQELETIFPELVHTAKDEMGTKSVNYVGLIAPMIEATKELKSENTALKSEIYALKTVQNETTAAIEELGKQVKLLNKMTGNNVGKASMGSTLTLLLGLLGGFGAALLFKRRKTA